MLHIHLVSVSSQRFQIGEAEQNDNDSDGAAADPTGQLSYMYICVLVSRSQ